MKLSTLGTAKLTTLFKNISYLPALPAEVEELVREIEDPGSKIELIVATLAADTALLENFRKLCMAHHIDPESESIVWLRAATYLLGANAVRRFIIANLIQRTVCVEAPGCLFNPSESIERSQRFGLMSECVFSDPISLWNGDAPEPGSFYISEILHELPRALLALQAPGTYNRIDISARTNKISFEDAFEELFDCCLAQLGEFAIQGWNVMGAIGASLILEIATSESAEHKLAA